MKRIWLTTFVVLLSMATMAVGTAAVEKEKYDGFSASASWAMGEGSFVYLYATTINDESSIQVVICTNNNCDNEGTLYTTDKIFNMDNKMNTAALSEVNVDLRDQHGFGSYVGTIKIKGDWTGRGDIYTEVEKWKYKYDSSMYKDSTDYQWRDATATAYLNGQPLGSTNNAGLSRFKTSYKLNQK